MENKATKRAKNSAPKTTKKAPEHTCKNCGKPYDKKRLERSLGKEAAPVLLGYCSARCYTKAAAKARAEAVKPIKIHVENRGGLRENNPGGRPTKSAKGNSTMLSIRIKPETASMLSRIPASFTKTDFVEQAIAEKFANLLNQ